MPEKPSDTQTVSLTEHQELKERLATLEGRLSAIQAPAVPPSAVEPNGLHDLDTFKDGEYKHRSTDKPFRLKVVPDDEHGKPYKLKSKEKYFEAATVGELEEHFHGDFSRFLPKKPDEKK